MTEVPVFQFKNLKQNIFYDTVMKAVARMPGYEYMYLNYGGAVRGGKTFICLYILHELARTFPGSRWCVIRQDGPALEKTSIPSMEKLVGKGDGNEIVWKRGKGNYQVVYKNGSRIFFMSENLQNDKNLDDFLGLEVNGFLLEQLETLSEKALSRAIERLGSWIIDPMPIPLLLTTFNPTPLWPKKKIYDKFIKGELEKPWFYQPALPDDNPFVTPEQWDNWQNLDPSSYRVMIGGKWVFDVAGNTWAYSFSEEKHVKPGRVRVDGQNVINPHFEIDRRLPVYLIFDFNVDPMTCLVCQRDGLLWGKVIKEYRLRTSDIYQMCDVIKTDLSEYYWIVSGDASGRNRNAGNRGAKSFVDTIKTELNLSDRQVQFPTANPSVTNTRVVVNSLLYKHPDFTISDECHYLIDDLMEMKTNEKGELDEKNIDKLKGHLFANYRYWCWNYFRKFVNIKF